MIRESVAHDGWGNRGVMIRKNGAAAHYAQFNRKRVLKVVKTALQPEQRWKWVTVSGVTSSPHHDDDHNNKEKKGFNNSIQESIELKKKLKQPTGGGRRRSVLDSKRVNTVNIERSCRPNVITGIL